MGQKKYILIEDEENYSSDSNHGCLKCLLWIILILVGIIILLVEAIISIDGNSTGSEKQSNNNYKNTQTGTTSGSDIDEAQSRESDVRYDPTTQYAPTPTNSTRTDTNTTSGSDIDEAQSRESDLRYDPTTQYAPTPTNITQTDANNKGAPRDENSYMPVHKHQYEEKTLTPKEQRRLKRQQKKEERLKRKKDRQRDRDFETNR